MTKNNSSNNLSLEQHLIAQPSRRKVLKAGAGMSMLSLFGGSLIGTSLSGCNTDDTSPLRFKSVATSTTDQIVVPEGYQWQVITMWGNPISPTGPIFKYDASNTADEQSKQFGMHHDGCHFFALPGNTPQGLWISNHEYTDEGLLHHDLQLTKDSNGQVNSVGNWTVAHTAKSQAAVGVSICKIKLINGKWQVVESQYARRITAQTPCRIQGVARGHEKMKTEADSTGTEVIGTYANCAHGVTPWGTYLTCEENFQGQFFNGDANNPNMKRYGISTRKNPNDASGLWWGITDNRFDAALHPNESNRFGWVVEIDPFDPQSKPIKRTSLGRFRHEGATTTIAKNKKIVVYMGDDQANEFIYKFVSLDDYHPTQRHRNKDILDTGILYVAKFNEDGTGNWLALIYGQNGLTITNGFTNQGDVVINARIAATIVGATPMDRSEWISIDPTTQDVYTTLTNNSGRKSADGPNPRINNIYGQILRWQERDANASSLDFTWEVFLLAGDPNNVKSGSTAQQAKIRAQGDIFGSPDGLWVDPRGMLWIDTDISTSVIGTGDYTALGNNMMLACDPNTKTVKRFLTGPKGCEITGVIMTTDLKTLFVNIQHPGEPASELSDPNNPLAISSFPEGVKASRPRSCTIAISRVDGQEIGS